MYERVQEHPRENPEGESKRWEQRALKCLPGVVMAIHLRIVRCTAGTAELTYPDFLTDIAISLFGRWRGYVTLKII